MVSVKPSIRNVVWICCVALALSVSVMLAAIAAGVIAAAFLFPVVVTFHWVTG